MRLLVIVKSSSADRDLGKHDLVRSAWSKYRTQIPLRFFVETPQSKNHKSGIMKSDETEIEPAFGNNDATFTRDILRWARSKAFDYVLVQEIDALVNPDDVVKANYQADYTGYFSWAVGERQGYGFKYKGVDEFVPNAHAFALGTSGFYLSYVAVHGLADRTPLVPRADVWVGQVVGEEAAKGLATISDLTERE